MKHWIGAHGLEITDEMKVTIAGVAARLSRNLNIGVYDRLTEIVIYPAHYAVKQGLANPDDGHDTALHEFAHVLDIRDGAFDGTPPIAGDAEFRAWVRVFSAHYSAMKRGKRRVLRSYGATNEAEFLAVATETFFEKPEQLRKKAPDLYAELARYYPSGHSRRPWRRRTSRQR